LKGHFHGADQDAADECFKITKIISVGLLESQTHHARIGTSVDVDAIVMLRVTNEQKWKCLGNVLIFEIPVNEDPNE
jgi:hypothetical protein